jgi:hypothetical protein
MDKGLRRRGLAPAVVRRFSGRALPRRRDRTFPPRSGGPRGLPRSRSAWPPADCSDGLPKERAYPRSPDPRGRNPGRFCAGTPAPREGSFGLWPPESGRDTTGGPRPPFGEWHPAGRNFGKEGATSSIRSCPRKPFARDPVQRGGSEGSIVRREGAGISGGFCRRINALSWLRPSPSFATALSGLATLPSPQRGEGTERLVHEEAHRSPADSNTLGVIPAQAGLTPGGGRAIAYEKKAPSPGAARRPLPRRER